jgi:hypothetical protein
MTERRSASNVREKNALGEKNVIMFKYIRTVHKFSIQLKYDEHYYYTDTYVLLPLYSSYVIKRKRFFLFRTLTNIQQIIIDEYSAEKKYSASTIDTSKYATPKVCKT